MIRLSRQSDHNQWVQLKGEHYVVEDDKGINRGSFGVVEVWPGYARAYFEFTKKDAYDFRFSTVKAIRKLLKERAPYYDRLEATCRTDYPEAVRLVEVLGFEEEGCLEGYDPEDGSSHLVFRFNGL